LFVYYYLIVALFASIAMIAAVLTVRLVRSRHSSSMRFVRSGMCLYVAMFIPYAVLQAITLGKLATLNNDRSSIGRDTVRISAAFAAFFGLGFSGQVALVQRWTYVVNLHTSGSYASPLGLQNTLRSTYKAFVWAIIVIVVLYLIGFSTLTNRFMDSVGRCAKLQDATCVSVSKVKGVQNLQQPCSEIATWTKAMQYYEGIWAAAVLAVFTFLAFLFNGVVFAM
jgi:hypothetical protein